MILFLLFQSALKALEALLARVVSTDAFWSGVEQVLRATCDLVILSNHPNTILSKAAADVLAILNDVDAQRSPAPKPA